MCHGTAGIKTQISSVLLICSGCAKILENSKLCYLASRRITESFSKWITNNFQSSNLNIHQHVER